MQWDYYPACRESRVRHCSRTLAIWPTWAKRNNFTLLYRILYRHTHIHTRHGATTLSRTGLPHYREFTITHRHTTVVRNPLDQWSAWSSTQHSQETDIHTPGGIRTHNPRKQAARYPCLRPRGHWDGPLLYIIHSNIVNLYHNRLDKMQFLFSLNVNLLHTYRLQLRLGSPNGLFP